MPKAKPPPKPRLHFQPADESDNVWQVGLDDGRAFVILGATIAEIQEYADELVTEIAGIRRLNAPVGRFVRR